MRYRWLISLALALIMLFPSTSYTLAAPDNLVRVIIGFRPGMTASEQISIISRGGGIVRRQYHIIPAMTAEIPARMISQLQRLEQVSYVETDIRVEAVGQTVPWGVAQVKADQVHAYNQGEGIKVAVIDTGIDLTHSDLSVYGGVNIINSSKSANDDNGHGTHVAGIIAALDNDYGIVGVAPEAQLYAVKVLDNSGSGWWSDVIGGIQWAIDNDMDIINMSLGASSGSTALRYACDRAYNAGILVVAAAGNNGKSVTTLNNIIYPAGYDSVIAVAAIDSSNNRASFSSTGLQVELSAPGVDVVSTYRQNIYKTLSGTSMASPHVAGVAALIMSSGIEDTNNDGNINDDVRLRLQETAFDLGATGRDRVYGYGLIDASLAAPSIANRPPVADAGQDQTVFVNTIVTLDGTGSADPDSDTITYAWNQTGGISENLSDNTAVNPSFTSSQAGDYKFSLIVNDGEYDSTADEVAVRVRAANSPPAAPVVAITPASPLTGDYLICDIIADSTDPDGDPVTYTYIWYKNNIVQDGITSCTVASLYTLKGEQWKCEVIPNDNIINGSSGSDSVTIGNTPPVADAGKDQVVLVNTSVTLDGSGSADADNDTLSYFWRQTGGDAISLSNGTSLKPSFIPSISGDHSFALIVNDGMESSPADIVSITVNTAQVHSMYIQSIDINLVVRYNGYRTYAITKITVVDVSGDPLRDVTVQGHWTGATSGITYAITNAAGQVTFSSRNLIFPRAGTYFSFTVDSLSKAGWIYEPLLNGETNDFVKVP